MPELPFLQVLAENLHRSLRGQTVTGVRVKQPFVLKTVDPPLDALEGDALLGVGRRGKHIIFELSSGRFLVVHLMRAGRLRLADPGSRSPAPTSLILSLSGGRELRLTEAGTRKRAAVWFFSSFEEVRALREYGFHPLGDEFTDEALGALLGEHGRQQLKALLVEQKNIAGIGNAFSDEILHAARLSPFKPAGSLTTEEVRALHSAIKSVLAEALVKEREMVGDGIPEKEHKQLYRVHDRIGEPCQVCGTPVEEISYASKSTFYCPECQTAGKLLADRRRSRFLK